MGIQKEVFRLIRSNTNFLTFWLPGVSWLENIEGLNPGQFVRSSRPLSNGFRVISKEDHVEILSTILHPLKTNIRSHKKENV